MNGQNPKALSEYHHSHLHSLLPIFHGLDDLRRPEHGGDTQHDLPRPLQHPLVTRRLRVRLLRVDDDSTQGADHHILHLQKPLLNHSLQQQTQYCHLKSWAHVVEDDGHVHGYLNSWTFNFTKQKWFLWNILYFALSLEKQNYYQ